jgi:hypothetical protein
MNIGYLNEYDSIRYKQSGKFYEGTITKVVNNDFPFIEGKFYETTSYSQRLDKTPFTSIIYAESFKGLDVEWWFEGQGCDNSAIGCSGHWDKLVA